MSLIFDNIAVTDTDDNEHSCRVCVEEYIPYYPATKWECEQPETVEWAFCERNGDLFIPSFEISEREDERIANLLIEKIHELRYGEEP